MENLSLNIVDIRWTMNFMNCRCSILHEAKTLWFFSYILILTNTYSLLKRRFKTLEWELHYCSGPVKSGWVKNTFLHPRPAILRRQYEGSENPGKLRNIGKKQEGAPHWFRTQTALFDYDFIYGNYITLHFIICEASSFISHLPNIVFGIYSQFLLLCVKAAKYATRDLQKVSALLYFRGKRWGREE